ncbi:MAG: PadR family transcriptional regulator [Patescibacteria group bacterium]
MLKNTEKIQSQMRKGILEFCILLVISKEKIYASDILKKLKEANLIAVEGTVYPILSRLKNSGLVEYTWEESKFGPPRKYYIITVKGLEILREQKNNWEDLVNTVNSLQK